MSLPLVTLPHIITPSLAISLLSDLLPRLSHSNPSIRKKTVATLYRLALVHPETLRSAWPRIKDILMDEGEGSSVTAAVVNVVCELGWRRPRDFLSLAPRLFDLLVDGGNNWMAIKIIKLFAILTPLEPRLIKKLLPPLTNLIKTTPAMSLLYECINGVIQGGVLEGTEGGREGEEIALLCVQKLRGMIVIEGDPNLKYVALLAFKRILASHPHLVSTQQDVIMSCIDDPDISIRLQALELGVGMVNGDTLVVFVERLIQQLRSAPLANGAGDSRRQHALTVEPAADSDGEDPEEALRSPHGLSEQAIDLPLDYRVNVIHQILSMCSNDTYANLSDFDWYIDVLMQLIKLVPLSSQDASDHSTSDVRIAMESQIDLSGQIGSELRNIAVRVSSIRSEVAHACNSLLKICRNSDSSSTPGSLGVGVLQYAAWVVGEYTGSCAKPYETLDSLLVPKPYTLPIDAICAYVQAIPKVFSYIVSHQSLGWSTERKTALSLLMSRIIDFLDSLAANPNLEVQERSVEFLELFRIASQAVASCDDSVEDPPILLTTAIPALFQDSELNPVAPSAQRKVPVPDGLDLNAPINESLQHILQNVEHDPSSGVGSTEFDSFYNERQVPKAISGPTIGAAIDSIPSLEVSQSYQESGGTTSRLEELVRRRTERREKNKDDPFYIGDEASSGTSTPFHDILRASNGDALDVDSIPIMNLDLGDKFSSRSQSDIESKKRPKTRSKKVHVARDETFGVGQADDPQSESSSLAPHNAMLQPPREKAKKSPLEVDSSNLGSISLTNTEDEVSQRPTNNTMHDQESEMAKALAEVERLRLEMQRASERIQASDGAPAEGTLVKKKKKKKKAKNLEPQRVADLVKGDAIQQVSGSGDGAEVKKKKKKKKAKETTADSTLANDGEEILYQG